MGLQTMLHLQAMLQCSQKLIGVGKLRMFTFGHQAAIGQAPEANQRVRRAQPGIAAAKSELQRLRNKLNFANPPAAEFDIKTLLFSFSLLVDFFSRQANVGQSGTHADIGAKNSFDSLAGKASIQRLATSSGTRPD